MNHPTKTDHFDISKPSSHHEAEDWPATFVKCVVWDLDGTLWDGVYSEQEGSLPHFNTAVVNVIKELDSKGILNSIASKNEPGLIRNCLEAAGVWELFLLPQIHWGTKSNSIRSIAEGLGIGIDSIAFIDDDPREREEVNDVFASVRTYAPDQIEHLLQQPEFMVPTSETSSSRRRMYQDEFKRREFRALPGLDNDRFLDRLNLVMTIREGMSLTGGERLVELLQRANNWHLTGHRDWTSEGLYAHLNSNINFIALSFDLEDRFGGYGCVGVALLEVDKSSDTVYVQELVMSCRAAAKTVDVAIVREIAKTAILHDVSRIVFKLIKTDRNIPMQRFLNSVCAKPIIACGEGFLAEIPNAKVFLYSKPKCFVNSISPRKQQIKGRKMKAKSGYSVKMLGEKSYLSADTLETAQSPRLFLLNRTGRIIWDLLKDNQTEDAVVTAVAKQFGMDKNAVFNDVHDFLVAARNENLIEES